MVRYLSQGNTLYFPSQTIEKMMFGDFVIERVIAFAGDYKGSHSGDIMLGTNVINNWEMTLSKKKHSFQFREDPPDSLPNKANIYQNYFNKEGNYVCVQDS